MLSSIQINFRWLWPTDKGNGNPFRGFSPKRIRAEVQFVMHTVVIEEIFFFEFITEAAPKSASLPPDPLKVEPPPA